MSNRNYTGSIGLDHARINDTDPDKGAKKYDRGHEQRRLKAYLKGAKYFAHGRRPSANGWVPIMHATNV